jgi:hypothetical protein
MGYHTSYAFSTPPDVVFGVLADVNLLARWLACDDLAIAAEPDGTCVVGAERYRVSLCQDERRLRWVAASGDDSWSGHAVVGALPVGGCVIQIKLALPAALRACIAHVDAIMSQALRRLDDEAARRSNAVRRAAA